MYGQQQFSCTATFCRHAREKTVSLYGAILRQTSKHAKTLEDACTPGAVLKLWVAKTLEKITLFVKMIRAKILMYGHSQRYSRWKESKNGRKTKGEASREYVFPFPTLWPCVWVWKTEIQTEGYSGTHRPSTRINAPTVGKGTWPHILSENPQLILQPPLRTHEEMYI